MLFNRHPAIPGNRARVGEATSSSRRRRWIAVVASVSTLLVPSLVGLSATPAQATSAAATAITIGTATTTGVVKNADGNVLFAKQGTQLTVTVVAGNATCVKVSDGTNAVEKPAPFTFTSTTTYLSTSTPGAAAALFRVGAANGTRTFTATGYKKNNTCTSDTGDVNGATQASYTVDNAGPTVTGTAALPTGAKAINAAGWATSNVTVNWAAADNTGGSGANAPSPLSEAVIADGVVTKTSTATDKVGNSGSGSFDVKIDRIRPSIRANRTPAANGFGWNNSNVAVDFPCNDVAPAGTTGVALSGVASCPSPVTFDSESDSHSATRTVTDAADNASDPVTATAKIDKTAPTISGAPTTVANANGFYNTDVKIAWNCNDPAPAAGVVPSGVATCPAAATEPQLKSEGLAQSVSGTVKDRADNTTTANSAPVNIDKTAPLTQVDNTNTRFNDTDVSIFLARTDNLSNVAKTNYTINGGATQAYDAANGIRINTPGVHDVVFWSEDRAGNVEDKNAPGHSVKVTIDGTPPTITAAQTPEANGNGWNNSDVTVTFTCTDAQSGIKSCLADGGTTASRTVTAEGQNQAVTGTATDNANNTTQATAHVSIDKTKPTLTATREPATANANGWNNSDVKVTFTCGDTAPTGVIASGVGACPPPATLAEGANQSASGSVTDAAGNTTAAGVTGVNVDKTDPNLSGVATTQPVDGWYRGDVTVAWTCSDALSGVVGGTATKPCPLAPSVLTGEGADLSASQSVSDKALNTKATTVGGISIDRTAPSTTGTAAPAVDWARTTVNVTLAPTDNLSGVKSTFYIVDGGAQQSGSSVALSTDGTHTVKYWSVDVAGNVETPKTITVKVDTQSPTISHDQTPVANNHGWNNTDVQVAFSCADQPTLSGVKDCTPLQTVNAEGKEQLVKGSTSDNAGNTADASAFVSIDKTLPAIVADADRAANPAGWYNSDVTVGFTCTDPAPATPAGVVPSGVDKCAAPKTLGEGANQSASGDVLDNAGNTASATKSGINVDKTKPTLGGAATTAPNGAGWYQGDVTITWACLDQEGLSGIAPGACPADDVLKGEGGALFATGTTHDVAGNEATANSETVKIDRMAPNTTADAPSGFVNNAVTIKLTANDALSGVQQTRFVLDGGAETVYDPTVGIVIGAEGVHDLKFWSVDIAGNVEVVKTAQVKVDRTAPTISHALTPAANGNGWNRADTTVTFTCVDPDAANGAAGSGIKSCTTPQLVATEGFDQAVIGTAVDNANNSQTDRASVSLDKTVPTITGAPDRTPNTAGWYKDDVIVGFTCIDPAPAVGVRPSNIDTCTAPQTVSTDSATNSVDGTAVDAAGNSTSATVSGLKVDKTAPKLTGTSGAGKNAAGWYRADATVNWACSDATSGIPAGTCPADSVVEGEGNDLGAEATVADAAGNSTTTAVKGIKIDRFAPVTTANAPSGWNNSDVTVNLEAHDGLSGVKSTSYKVDGGAAVEGTAVTFSTNGTHTLEYSSVDVADNAEAPRTVTVKIDKLRPTITHAQAPVANGNGWNNGDVTVTFTCTDQDGLSGIAPNGCTARKTVTTEGKAQPVTGVATDNANNSANDATTVSIDKGKPTIAGKADREANGNGWYKADVTVSFTCDDGLSGIKTCPADSTVMQGRGQTVKGTATDAADNSADDTVGPLNVDKSKPMIGGANGPASNAAGWNNSDVTVAWTCGDPELAPTVAGSGIAAGGCPGTSKISGEGTGLTRTASVTDRADNTGTATSPAVKIDRTAPSTDVEAPSDWQPSGVTVTLKPADNLSGVKATKYTVDGGAEQTGTTIAIDTEGTHTVQFWSVDNADNTETHNTATVKIDKTQPTIVHALTPAANAKSWNKADTTVDFTCTTSGPSGIKSCTADGTAGTTPGTASKTVTTEGQGQIVTGVATNGANVSKTDPASVSIDKTAPTISGAPDRAANGAGWYNADVKVSYSCDDVLSKIASCSPADTLATEGNALSATGTAVDTADNSASATVSGIKLDKTAPSLTGTAGGGKNAAGWYNGDVTVTWACADGMSGIPTGTCPPVSTVTGEGADVSTTASVKDTAGNDTTTTVKGLQIDRTAPSTTAKPDQAANGDDWYRKSVTLTLTAADALSGVKATRYTLNGGAEAAYPATGVVLNEGVNTVKYWSVDVADNAEAAKTITVQIDATAPTITGKARTAPNANGWYAGDVVVDFTCADALSGVKTCQAPVTVTGDGANRYADGTATDKAGNSSTARVDGLKIDTAKPVITTVNVDTTKPYVLGTAPAAICTATDTGGSGFGTGSSCTVSTSGGNANGTGAISWTATSTDQAGNTATKSGTYRVAYRFDGFLQPINDTAHQTQGTPGTSMSTSIFKAGSSIPFKFQLRNAAGQIVQANVLPVFPTPSKGSSTAAAPNETLYSDTGTIGGTYVWDAVDQKYQFNWKTPSTGGGFYYRAGVKLDDGQTYYVNIGLR